MPICSAVSCCPSQRPHSTGDPSSPSPMLSPIWLGSGCGVCSEWEATVMVATRPSTSPARASRAIHSSCLSSVSSSTPKGPRTCAHTSPPSGGKAAEPLSEYKCSSSSAYSSIERCIREQSAFQQLCCTSHRVLPVASTMRTACRPVNTAASRCGDTVTVPNRRGQGAGKRTSCDGSVPGTSRSRVTNSLSSRCTSSLRPGHCSTCGASADAGSNGAVTVVTRRAATVKESSSHG